MIAKRFARAGDAAPTPLIHEAQTGGMRGRSTTDNLLLWKLMIEDAHEYNKDLHVIYTDISGAYDAVPSHTKLLSFAIELSSLNSWQTLTTTHRSKS